MKFEFEGSTYYIDFTREHKEVKAVDRTTGAKKLVKSRYPYTTVTITRDVPGAEPGEVFRQATVGAFKTERFTKEQGRLAALRAVTSSFSKGEKAFKALLWKSYVERKHA